MVCVATHEPPLLILPLLVPDGETQDLNLLILSLRQAISPYQVVFHRMYIVARESTQSQPFPGLRFLWHTRTWRTSCLLVSGVRKYLGNVNHRKGSLVDPIKFARLVWKKQRRKGYVFLSWKDGDGEWHDKAYVWPGDITLPNDGQDVYFCPSVFSRPKRQKQYALSSVWLHADLDEVVPRQTPPLPTLAWETSPKRFQALWLLDKALGTKAHGELNQKLTYFTGSDKGGWSITKVLRLPGTVSTKYRDPWKVRVVRKGDLYRVRDVARTVHDVVVTPGSVPITDVSIPDMTPDAVMHKYRGKLPKRARELLRAKRAPVGERSERLWELECLLLEAGVPPEETLILVRDTVWNKFSGQRRELPQLWAEVQKAAAQTSVSSDAELETMPLEFVSYDKFLATPLPKTMWTVEGVWSHEAHGLIAGEPKSYKSLIATDLAVSVASGTKFLGHFPVPETGPVIIIQEENPAWMFRDRMEKIVHSRGLGGHASMNGNYLSVKTPETLPIQVMNNRGFNLLSDDHRGWLEEQIQQARPKLVILDPIYLMTPGVDENSASEMIPVLKWLLTLKQEHSVGILIIHHYNKPRDGENRSAGNRISGTNAFYRWFESAVYLEKMSYPGRVKLTAEHRGAAPGDALQIDFDMGDLGDPHYEVELEFHKNEAPDSFRKMLIRVVETEPGITTTGAAEKLESTTDRVKKIAERVGIQIRRGKSDGSAGRPPSRLYPPSRSHTP